jgi:hypothetical protein
METLAEVKYPKTATFVTQQNNAYRRVHHPHSLRK